MVNIRGTRDARAWTWLPRWSVGARGRVGADTFTDVSGVSAGAHGPVSCASFRNAKAEEKGRECSARG